LFIGTVQNSAHIIVKSILNITKSIHNGAALQMLYQSDVYPILKVKKIGKLLWKWLICRKGIHRIECFPKNKQFLSRF